MQAQRRKDTARKRGSASPSKKTPKKSPQKQAEGNAGQQSLEQSFEKLVEARRQSPAGGIASRQQDLPKPAIPKSRLLSVNLNKPGGPVMTVIQGEGFDSQEQSLPPVLLSAETQSLAKKQQDSSPEPTTSPGANLSPKKSDKQESEHSDQDEGGDFATKF